MTSLAEQETFGETYLLADGQTIVNKAEFWHGKAMVYRDIVKTLAPKIAKLRRKVRELRGAEQAIKALQGKLRSAYARIDELTEERLEAEPIQTADDVLKRKLSGE
jgi:exonuclease VII small subunit